MLKMPIERGEYVYRLREQLDRQGVDADHMDADELMGKYQLAVQLRCVSCLKYSDGNVNTCQYCGCRKLQRILLAVEAQGSIQQEA